MITKKWAILLTIFTIILSITSTQVVDSYSIPGKSAIPPASEIASINAPSAPMPSSVASGQEEVNAKGQVNNPGEFGRAPVQIEKAIIPSGEANYLINSTLQIVVEINVEGNDLKYIQSLEYLDDSLNIINVSKCYVANNLQNIAEIEDGLIDQKSLKNNTNYLEKIPVIRIGKNILSIDKENNFDRTDLPINNLENKGRLIYWYYIQPKRAGNYKTTTIVRTNDDYPDIKAVSNLPIVKNIPKFLVDVDIDKLEANGGVDLNPTYNIRYVGGSSDPYFCNITLNPSETYNISGTNSFKESFKLYDLKKEKANIRYPFSGKFYLPGISIEDLNNKNESVPANFTFVDKEITIDSWGQQNEEPIGWILALVGIILGQIYSVPICNYSTKHKRNSILIACTLIGILVIFYLYY